MKILANVLLSLLNRVYTVRFNQRAVYMFQLVVSIFTFSAHSTPRTLTFSARSYRGRFVLGQIPLKLIFVHAELISSYRILIRSFSKHQRTSIWMLGLQDIIGLNYFSFKITVARMKGWICFPHMPLNWTKCYLEWHKCLKQKLLHWNTRKSLFLKYCLLWTFQFVSRMICKCWIRKLDRPRLQEKRKCSRRSRKELDVYERLTASFPNPAFFQGNFRRKPYIKRRYYVHSKQMMTIS